VIARALAARAIESAAGTFQSTRREPGDLLPRIADLLFGMAGLGVKRANGESGGLGVRRLAPAALIRRTFLDPDPRGWGTSH